MGAWITLAAGVVGAAIALVGQQVTRHGEVKIHSGELLLEQCAQVLALSHDYTNRVWEERQLGLAGRVDGWDGRAHRFAVARLRILSANVDLRQALDELENAGEDLGKFWRSGNTDPDHFDLHWRRFIAARTAFENASADVIRQRLGNR